MTAGQGRCWQSLSGCTATSIRPLARPSSLPKPLDPAQLGGTVPLMYLANVPAFLGRRIQGNTQDSKKPEPHLSRPVRWYYHRAGQPGLHLAKSAPGPRVGITGDDNTAPPAGPKAEGPVPSGLKHCKQLN
ncbi:MAG: hypothetical protein EOO60_13725 [Hymenobacter sp.]|nr:MAG: hypothetical protein EOO60_13725 [Hymenobacter sp.]